MCLTDVILVSDVNLLACYVRSIILFVNARIWKFEHIKFKEETVLRSSGILLSVYWQFLTDLTG